MHILLEEAPILVFYFLTLFLIHISDPFYTSVDFIHFLDHIYLLSIGAHLLTHFVRSLVRLALPSLHCGCFPAHLLTHFVRSLVRLALPSVTQLPLVAFATCAHSLCSFALVAKAPFGRLMLPLVAITTSTHFVRTCRKSLVL